MDATELGVAVRGGIEGAGEGCDGEVGTREEQAWKRTEAFWRRAAMGEAAAERRLTPIGALRVAPMWLLMEEGGAAEQSLATSRVARAAGLMLRQQDEVETKQRKDAGYVSEELRGRSIVEETKVNDARRNNTENNMESYADVRDEQAAEGGIANGAR